MAINVEIIAPEDLFPIMQFARTEKLALMILGEPGCGKSEMVTQFANAFCDGNFIDLRLNTVQAIDVRGMSVPDMDNNITRFLPPEFLPGREGDSRLNGVLFLDEFDRCSPDNQAAAMPILLERRSGQVKIPDGWLVVAAGNGVEFSDHTIQFDPAVADRMIIVKMLARPETSIKWGSDTGRYHPLVLAFLKKNPDDLSHAEKRRETGDLVAPSARGWEKVSKVLFARDTDEAANKAKDANGQSKAKAKKTRSIEDIAAEDTAALQAIKLSVARELNVKQRQAVIAGIIGKGVAGRFFLFMEEMNNYVAIDELMAEKDRAKRVKMLPDTEQGMFYLAFGLKHMIKDMETAERALSIINDFSEVGERNPNLPLADIKTNTAEQCFEKMTKELKLTAQIARCQEYKDYIKWRDGITNGAAHS